jgi:hypothetical protein
MAKQAAYREQFSAMEKCHAGNMTKSRYTSRAVHCSDAQDLVMDMGLQVRNTASSQGQRGKRGRFCVRLEAKPFPLLTPTAAQSYQHTLLSQANPRQRRLGVNVFGMRTCPPLNPKDLTGCATLMREHLVLGQPLDLRRS